jgi:hypothetical protein
MGLEIDRMTKRFTGEFDKQYSGVYDNGEQLTNFEVVDLLNDLHEERNYFERKKCRYWNKFNLAQLDNINLQKENEQLKHKLQQQEMEYATDLHRLAEENEKLKEQIADLETSFDICKHYKEAYGTEIVKIKQTIKDMLENERTELGRSVLRQLWEAIQ